MSLVEGWNTTWFDTFLGVQEVVAVVLFKRRMVQVVVTY